MARAIDHWSGKVVVHARNSFGIAPDELQSLASTDRVASAFAGAQAVKSPNPVPAELLALDSAEQGGRRVMFVASSDDAAAVPVTRRVANLGFGPLTLGSIQAAGGLPGRGRPRVLQNPVELGA